MGNIWAGGISVAFDATEEEVAIHGRKNRELTGLSARLVGFEKLNEPVENVDYIHFAAFPACHGEVVVLSHQMGCMNADFIAQYRPGARLYIDYHMLVQDALLVRDGLHCTKVKD